MTDYIKKYSKDIGIDILDKVEKGLENPKTQFGTILTPFLDSALCELYRYGKDFVLRNKEGILDKIQGDSINFFGAITELCVGGLFAPIVIQHSSPDYILSLNECEIRVEVTNRISHRGKIGAHEWPKEHRSTLDKIDEKKYQRPNFLFICFLERASERLRKPLIRNIPVSWQSRSILTPETGIQNLLDSELQGIISYDYTPLNINSAESGIIHTDLAFRLIEILKQRFAKMFTLNEIKNVLYVLDKIMDQAVHLSD